MRALILICFFVNPLWSQYDHEAVFPLLEDEALFNALVNNYKTGSVLDLSEVRDTLYKTVHLHKDSVRCIYSGLARYLDPNADPSTYLFGTGGNTDINLEHSFPKSKGASFGLAERDMHHLYPARVAVNFEPLTPYQVSLFMRHLDFRPNTPFGEAFLIACGRGTPTYEDGNYPPPLRECYSPLCRSGCLP